MMRRRNNVCCFHSLAAGVLLVRAAVCCCVLTSTHISRVANAAVLLLLSPAAAACCLLLGYAMPGGVYFGQLLGMADHLSFTLGANGYKCAPACPLWRNEMPQCGPETDSVLDTCTVHCAPPRLPPPPPAPRKGPNTGDAREQARALALLSGACQAVRVVQSPPLLWEELLPCTSGQR